MPYPYAWPYYNGHVGGDFSDFQPRFKFFHTAHFFNFNGPAFMYPAPLAIIYRLLYGVWGNRPHSQIIFWLISALIVLSVAIGYTVALARKGISATGSTSFVILVIVFSYPLYFVMQRGNVEIFVWAFLLAAVWCYRTHRATAAAILMGIAIALKWYPVILLGVFLSEKKYKLILISILSAVVTTLLSAMLLGPTIQVALHETSRGMQVFIDMYAKRYQDFGYDHSFFAFFKFWAHPFHLNLPNDLNRYMALAAVSGISLYFLRLRKMPVINQLAVLIILSITLPPVSYDYTLLQLYICFGLFTLYLLEAHRNDLSVPFSRAMMIWFAFTMAPHGYIIFHHQRYCGPFRFIGLAALLHIFIRQPFPEIKDRLTASRSQIGNLRNVEGTEI